MPLAGYPAPDAGRDAVLEWVAKWIEDRSLTDFRGVMARKKRDREDAELRCTTRAELRDEMARSVRAMIGREDLGPTAILERIRDTKDGIGHVVLLRDAWPLAWQGLVAIECRVMCNDNTIPPRAEYRVTLTEKGREMLERQPVPERQDATP